MVTIPEKVFRGLAIKAYLWDNFANEVSISIAEKIEFLKKTQTITEEEEKLAEKDLQIFFEICNKFEDCVFEKFKEEYNYDI